MEFTAEILNQLEPHHIVSQAIDWETSSIDHIVNYYNYNRRTSKAVLHAALMIAMQYNKGRIPNKVYLDKTLQSLKKEQILNPGKAANELNKLIDWKIKGNKPEWLDEYLTEISQMEG